MKLKGFLLIVLVVVAFSAIGQQDRENARAEMMKMIKAKKIAFITDQLDLTPAEAERFWPLYNENEKERNKINEGKRECLKGFHSEGENMNDKYIISLIDRYIALQVKESELAEKYNKRFQKVITPEKLLKLYQMEGRFKALLIREYRGRKNRGSGWQRQK